MKKIVFFMVFSIFFPTNIHATDIGSSELLISLHSTNQGMELAAIKNREDSLLAAPSPLFTLILQRISDQTEITISSTDQWKTITTDQNDAETTIIFLNPNDQNLPAILQVTMTVVARSLCRQSHPRPLRHPGKCRTPFLKT